MLVRAKRQIAKVLSGFSKVSLPDTLLSTKRLEISAKTPRDTTFVLRKDLTSQQLTLVPHCPVSYMKVCQLHSPRSKAALFTSANYEMYVSVDLHGQIISTVEFLIITDAGANLINKSFAQPTWTPRARSRDFIKLTRANK